MSKGSNVLKQALFSVKTSGCKAQAPDNQSANGNTRHLMALNLLVLSLLMLKLFMQPAQAASSAEKQTITLGMPQEQFVTISSYQAIIEEAFSRAKVELKIVVMPGNRATYESRAGTIDGEVARTEYLEFRHAELIPIKVDLKTIDYWVLVHHQGACPATISDLYRLTSVSLLGATVHHKIRELIPSPNVTVRSPEALLQMLQAERGDYVIAPIRAAKNQAQEYGIPIKPCFDKPFLTTRSYTYLHKRHAHLIPKLEAAYTWVMEKQATTAAATP